MEKAIVERVCPCQSFNMLFAFWGEDDVYPLHFKIAVITVDTHNFLFSNEFYLCSVESWRTCKFDLQIKNDFEAVVWMFVLQTDLKGKATLIVHYLLLGKEFQKKICHLLLF